MPSNRKRKSPSVEVQGEPPAPKRRRASQASTSSTPGSRRSARLQRASSPLVIQDSDDDIDDLFGEGKKPAKSEEEDDEKEDIIDLVTTDEPPAPPKPPKKPGRVEFAAFQCAICMDNATNVAVTHCGHLFCSECLQSALHTEATRNRCPICRQKIEHKERDAYSARTKGFWHLELKPMTATKKGKQPTKG